MKHQQFLRSGVGILLALSLQACAAKPKAGASALTPEERVQKLSEQMGDLVTGGTVENVVWSEDGSHFTYTRNDQRLKFDLASRAISPVTAEEAATTQRDENQPRRRRGGQGQNRQMPERGRQFTRAESPDGKWVVVCKEWNVVLEPVKKDDEQQGGGDATSRTEAEPIQGTTEDTTSRAVAEPINVTTDGHRKFRYGTASWVYGEELDQREAMWWSPDSKKLVFYEFDEREVPDHFITAGMTDLHTRVLTEGYPKAGEPNPIANLIIYDLESESMTQVRMPDDEGEWYTYAVQFAPDGSELLFNRTNRHQNLLHVMAADLETGATRIVVSEQQETWQENRPLMRFLDDNRRFIWETEKTGWKQYELRDLDGTSINTLTIGEYPVASIVEVDEENGVLYYMAYSEPMNALSQQLQRVNLDGSKPMRLTKEPHNHSVRLSPDHKWFITRYEGIEQPPITALYDINGDRIATLAESEMSKFNELGLEMPELFTFAAADGTTEIYGVLHKPSDFDPRRKYPLLIDVYGGPLSQAIQNRFTPANPSCEQGFLIARCDNRGTQNRGKAFEAAAYLKLGVVDIQDQVDGVKYLSRRPYVDSNRVGIYGHSYGGYMAALAILKYPEVFHAAVAGAPVTHWKNYDTIYTERFMRTPQENTDGYEDGACLTYADQLEGHLLMLHGMADDNVHPNNTFQLVDLLQKAGKDFAIMFWPNAGHGLGAGASTVRWRFLRAHLLN